MDEFPIRGIRDTLMDKIIRQIRLHESETAELIWCDGQGNEITFTRHTIPPKDTIKARTYVPSETDQGRPREVELIDSAAALGEDSKGR